MRKAKKKFSCCYEDFYSEKLAENLYSTQKNGFFLVLQVKQEIWNFVLRLARHRKWKKSPTILTLHALLKDVCQLT